MVGENQESTAPGLDSGIVHSFAEYTTEELLDHAQANAQGAHIVALAFLQQRGFSIDEWAKGMGLIFAKAWDTSRTWDAAELMDAMLTNYRALGAVVEAADLDPDRSVATINGFPDADLCAAFQVDVELTARFNDVATVIAREVGVTWEWRRDKGKTHFVATRASE